MYGGFDGHPPFRPPPTNLPPFPPNLSGAPPAFPPFPPQAGAGFVRPPFPPNLPTTPGGGPPPQQFQQQQQFQNGSPLPIRPNHSPYSSVRPSHPGIGLPPMPSNLPAPPHRMNGSSTPSGFVKEVKTTSVFIGGIAPGTEDSFLIELLNACGPLHELKRVSGASGRPQAFGFANFESPEVVMRCIRCLNGVELPDISPEGRRDNKPPKPLVVKVDDKTKDFLDEFEATLGRTEDDENADAATRKLIAQIVARVLNPQAPTPDHPNRSGGRSPITVIVPAHLQDLREGDLPEGQRVAVLDQIAVFRENAARKERAKKALEDEQELAKLSAPAGYKKPPNPMEYGYGQRAFVQPAAPSQPRNRQNQQQNQQQQQQQQQYGHQQAQGQGGNNGQRSSNPQDYSRPVDFVKAQTAEAKALSGRTDEEEEEIRRSRIAREKEGALRERERNVEHRERLRIENLNREMAHRRQQTELEERNRRMISDKLENFDDDEAAERGKEWFFLDRNRWRNARQQTRTREYQDDVRDRHAEAEEIKALEKESEEFLQRQMEEMAKMEEAQKARGLLSEDAAPIRLALAVPAPSAEPALPKVEPMPTKAPIAFGGDEDDDELEGEKKTKRHLVKLDYNESDLVRMTPAEQAAIRNAQLLEIRVKVPRDRRDLWDIRLDWDAINKDAVRSKIRSFVNTKLEDYLGEVDQDLADYIMENIAGRKDPNVFVDGLEPILAEDSTPLVIQIWRLLAFETAAAKAGIESGTMLV